MKDFQFTYWKDSPRGEGLVTLDKTCTYEQLRQAVKNLLEGITEKSADGDTWTLYDHLDYLNTSVHYADANNCIPVFQWIYCWVTEGSSEGHYIHVECYTPKGDTHPLLLAKTFSGQEVALTINTEISRFILSQRI